jgi:RecA-family ATPase
MNPPFSFQENVVWICEDCAAVNKVTAIPDYDGPVHQDPEEELYQIENPIRDLLNSEIDRGQNILGNFWLERGAYNVIVGPSGVGKSVVSIQGAIEAAAKLPVFGMTTSEPLRVVVVQAEDSRNDRIMQVQCIKQIVASQGNLDRLGLSPEELIKRIEENFHIFTTTQLRGAELFETLAREFTDHVSGKSRVDLFFFNPAFAFLKGSASSDEAVKTFLRSELAPFLKKMHAAAIVIHHVPKPPRRGVAKRSAETSMYSPHGSAEWTNGP